MRYCISEHDSPEFIDKMREVMNMLKEAEIRPAYHINFEIKLEDPQSSDASRSAGPSIEGETSGNEKSSIPSKEGGSSSAENSNVKLEGNSEVVDQEQAGSSSSEPAGRSSEAASDADANPSPTDEENTQIARSNGAPQGADRSQNSARGRQKGQRTRFDRARTIRSIISYSTLMNLGMSEANVTNILNPGERVKKLVGSRNVTYSNGREPELDDDEIEFLYEELYRILNYLDLKRSLSLESQATERERKMTRKCLAFYNTNIHQIEIKVSGKQDTHKMTIKYQFLEDNIWENLFKTGNE